MSDQPIKLALYCRVSSDEQAERETIQAQTSFLQDYTRLYGLPVYDIYADDPAGGSVPLGERPEGGRLLKDAALGRFNTVLLFKIDRLARKLRVLLDAQAALEGVGVGIRSATEPIDTTTPTGRFVFQLLGSFAELDKANILDRMTAGRDRVIKNGQWTNGPVPFGYDLDANRRLIPSKRYIDGLDTTEAVAVAELFRRISEGSTAYQEAERFNAYAVPTARRYSGRKKGHSEPTRAVLVAERWATSRVVKMVHSTIYKGIFTYESARGAATVEVPALVTPELWEAANAQLTRNRDMSTKNAKHVYLLRGLIKCARCGRSYIGSTVTAPSSRTSYRYYKCDSGVTSRLTPAERCKSKFVRAEEIEAAIWEDCREFIRNPGPALEEARAKLRDRLSVAAESEPKRQALRRQIADLDAQRERILTLFRRNLITLDDVETQLHAIDADTVTLQREFEAVRAAEEIAFAFEKHLTEASAMLARLRGRVDEIEASDDTTAKRAAIEKLVNRIDVHTEGEGRQKVGRVVVTYAFREPSAVNTTNARSRRR